MHQIVGCAKTVKVMQFFLFVVGLLTTQFSAFLLYASIIKGKAVSHVYNNSLNSSSVDADIHSKKKKKKIQFKL